MHLLQIHLLQNCRTRERFVRGKALYRDRHHPQGSCRHAAEGLLARLQASQNRPGRAFDPKDLWFGDVDRQWHQAWRAWTRSPQLPRESATPGPSRPRASWCASVSTATDSVPASSANDGVIHAYTLKSERALDPGIKKKPAGVATHGGRTRASQPGSPLWTPPRAREFHTPNMSSAYTGHEPGGHT